MLDANLIEQNYAADGGGGARVSHVAARLTDNLVRDNVAGGTGGGLDLDNDASLVRGGEITGNLAGGSGGGIFGWLAPWTGLVVEDVLIAGNHAWQGGGLYLVDNFMPVTMRGLRVIGNTASKGAGLMVSATSFELTRSVLSDNVATNTGGAIHAGASVAWTGPCPCPPISPIGQIAFVVATGNEAPYGSALWTTFAGLSVENSILFDNAGVAVEASDTDAAPGIMVTPHLAYDDIYPPTFAGMEDPLDGTSNISVDPQFVSAATGDFHLLADSACIDSGDLGLVDVDGSRADMGIYGGVP